ncbi:GNAT family N-acetyltransferase [Gordonia sp. PDNC005]|uniref:GNAT family N-acetyltransferase n=1 Tax=unclassified Gordonia (in: high G+C Gram-positive bacteria) TaxID=2657482 RepID=UPI0019651FBD|nr:GNAT family N-acetyltransferase [Gordonia sp. PDNC005]QRY61855.1 GNAT family N-acetyltransferase [Gordonia sp. PDNC005]
MTDVDQATTRRDITDALLKAFERRHEVLDAIFDADDRDSAADAIATLLDTSRQGVDAVLHMSLDQLTKDSRRKNQAALDDLNSEITFTLAERPASSGDTLDLRPFSADDDADIFAERTAEQGVAGDGSGAPAGELGEEISAASDRVDSEDAVWLVAVDDDEKVGIVFGELTDGAVDVRIWIRPESRKKGYGVSALRRSRTELAAYFPGVPLTIRAPGATA